MRSRGSSATWLLAVACAAPSPRAAAQTLDGVTLTVDGSDLVARVTLSGPVRLVQQPSQPPARRVQFQIEPVAADQAPPTERTIDARTFAATEGAAAFTVALYSAARVRTQQLALEIDEPALVRARPGANPNTIEVVLVGKAARDPRGVAAAGWPYTVRLASGPVAAMGRLPPVPSRFQDFETFDLRSVADGVQSFELHLGHFSTKAEAEAARASLHRLFPQAAVVALHHLRPEPDPQAAPAQPRALAASTPSPPAAPATGGAPADTTLARPSPARTLSGTADRPGVAAPVPEGVPAAGMAPIGSPAPVASPAPDGSAPALTVPESATAGPSTQIVVGVRLNGIVKGDAFAYMTADSDILLPRDQLVAMGVANPIGRSVEIGGESLLSLRSIPGAEHHLDQKSLTLDLKLPPAMLPAQSLDLGASQPATPVEPRAPGGFLNYRVAAARTQGGGLSYSGTTELGLNIGQLLLLDNRTFSSGSDQRRSVRLQTQLIHDQPETLRRWVVGDFFASSGDLGSAFNLGGISFSKLYQINPYLVRTPLASFAGAVTLPSVVDIYVDGRRVRSDRVAPGSFSLQNISGYDATGLRNVEVVIRDAFGREERIAFAHFFTDQLLAAGLHEYSYNAGVMRSNFGAVSNDYGAPAVSAFHRYGVSDRLTAGVGADATRRHVNLGATVTVNTVKLGVVSAGLSFSRDRGSAASSGTAASLDHTFVHGPFSSQVFLRRYSAGYVTLGFSPENKPKLLGSAGFGYGSVRAGTVSLSHNLRSEYGGAGDQHTTTVSYTKLVAQDVALTASLSRVAQEARGWSAFLGLSVQLGQEASVNASQQRTPEGDRISQLQLSRSAPVGEGLGYHVLAQHATAGGASSRSFSPYVQFGARHGLLAAEGTSVVSDTSGSSGFYQLSLSGSAVVIGREVYFGRPVSDSYGVARIEPPLAGVRVLRSNSEVGSTDAGGTVFVPGLGSYQVNEVALQPKDLPLEYSLSPAGRKVRPPLRSGVLIPFSVTRIRAISGSLKLRRDGGLVAIGDLDIVLTGPAGSARIRTIGSGDFYAENLAPGVYSAQLTVEGGTCRLALTVPDSQDVVAELGEIICERVP